MTEREYDEVFNEGASDGFNPYRKGFDDGEPMWSKVESRIAKIGRLLNGIGDAAFDAERKAKLESERAELKALYATMDKN